MKKRSKYRPKGVLLNPLAYVLEGFKPVKAHEDYGDVVKRGLDAVHAVGRRGLESGRFILRAQEMVDLNDVLELHDAQMDIITIKDMEQAMKLMTKEYEQGKMRSIARSEA